MRTVERSDGNDCTSDSCIDGHSPEPSRQDLCEAGQSCDLRTGRCKLGDACFDDEDCDDGEACTSNERCDPALRVCVWSTLDGDSDREAPMIRGGTDCNDSNPAIPQNKPELCDGLDNDCNGEVDTQLATAACGDGYVCKRGDCVCNTGLTECALSCTDTLTDPNHCGGCNEECRTSEVCEQGTCVCPSGMELCDGACRTPDWFATDADHCGACGTVCTSNEVCEAGACRCADGLAECNDQCFDTQISFQHCGGCGNACDVSYGVCVEGACRCASATERICDDVCVPRGPLNCGSCGTTCAQCGVNDACVDVAKLYVGHVGSCALMTNGEVWCWGLVGALTQSQPKRIEITTGTALSGVVHMETGWQHTCAITNTAQVYCWGYSTEGALGAGATTESYLAVPVELSAGVPLTGVAELASRRYATMCARMSIGECLLLGKQHLRHAGQRQRCGFLEPTAARRNGSRYGADRHRQAIRRHEHRVRAPAERPPLLLGGNGSGRVGEPAPVTSRSRPALVEASAGVGLAGVTEVAMGDAHSCARLSSGQVYCWGNNSYGQLGNGSSTSASRPVRAEVAAGTPLANTSSITAGRGISCARLSNGEVYCWGRNDYGQAGGPFGVNATRPKRIGADLTPAFLATSGPRVTSLYATANTLCAEGNTSNRELACWGYGTDGTLGNGTTSSSSVPVGVGDPLNPLIGVADYGVGQYFGCALLENGLVYCWGSNNLGQLGTNDGIPYSQPKLVLWP